MNKYKGTIVSYDPVSAWGIVKSNKQTLKFHATSFWSLRRGLPKPGEPVEVWLTDDGGIWEVSRPYHA